MSQNFATGDLLVFQIEAGFGLLRMLDRTEDASGRVWHVAVYGDFFPDVDSAEAAAQRPDTLSVAIRHAALTNRAFESTQVARIANLPLTDAELTAFNEWRSQANGEVFDRSIRLLLGIR